jgi:hypothetical protein
VVRVGVSPSDGEVRSPFPPPPFAVLSELEAGQKNTFLWRFCAFLNKGSSKTPPKLFWKKYVTKTFCQKVEGGKKKSCHLPPSIFF